MIDQPFLASVDTFQCGPCTTHNRSSTSDISFESLRDTIERLGLHARVTRKQKFHCHPDTIDLLRERDTHESDERKILGMDVVAVRKMPAGVLGYITQRENGIDVIQRIFVDKDGLYATNRPGDRDFKDD